LKELVIVKAVRYITHLMAEILSVKGSEKLW